MTRNFTSVNKSNLLAFTIFFGLSSFLILLTIRSGELLGPDTFGHIMTGIFLSDFLKEKIFLRSIPEMWNYTWTYYAHYSIIGLIHWPPLFHLIEAVYFRLFNFDEPAARFLIYLFSILGLFYYYRLMLQLYNNYIAFLASVLFITSPTILFHSRVLSLEIPSLTFALISIYYFYLFTKHQRTVDGLLVTIFTALALLTKQNNVFLCFFYLVYLLVYIFILHRKAFIRFGQFLLFFVILILLVGPYYYIAFTKLNYILSGNLYKGNVFDNPYTQLNYYLYYLVTLPQQIQIVTILLLILFIFLLGAYFKKIIDESNLFMLSWAISCFGVFTLIAVKDERYIIYWVPALTGLAAFSICFLANNIINKFKIAKPNLIVWLIIFIISSTSFTISILTPNPYIFGYDNLAKSILSKIPEGHNEIIFFDGTEGYGKLAYSLRKFDPERRIFLFRSSKMFYAGAFITKYAHWEIINKKADMVDYFKRYGIRYIVLSYITDGNDDSKTLRELITEDQNFVLVDKFAIIKNHLLDGFVNLYLYKGTEPLTHEKELDIPMPILNRFIKIKLKPQI